MGAVQQCCGVKVGLGLGTGQETVPVERLVLGLGHTIGGETAQLHWLEVGQHQHLRASEGRGHRHGQGLGGPELGLDRLAC